MVIKAKYSQECYDQEIPVNEYIKFNKNFNFKEINTK